jgi:hypothetical protein
LLGIATFHGLRHQLGAHACREPDVVGFDPPGETVAPHRKVVHPGPDPEIPPADAVDAERRGPEVVAERLHLGLVPLGVAGAAITDHTGDALVAVRETRRAHDHVFPHDPLDGEAAAVHRRLHLLDDGRRGHRARSRQGAGSGVKATTDSGGSVRRSEWLRPCQGVGRDSTRPRLPMPLPP